MPSYAAHIDYRGRCRRYRPTTTAAASASVTRAATAAAEVAGQAAVVLCRDSGDLTDS